MWKIQNVSPSTLWVAIMYYAPNCSDGGNWEKKGWWQIASGQSKIVYGGSMRQLNRYFYFYAETANGKKWSGLYVRSVPPQAFDWCEWTTNTQARNVGFRQLDINNFDNYTLNLIP